MCYVLCQLDRRRRLLSHYNIDLTAIPVFGFNSDNTFADNLVSTQSFKTKQVTSLLKKDIILEQIAYKIYAKEGKQIV